MEFFKRRRLKVRILVTSVVIFCFLALGPISSVYGQNGVQARIETSGPAIVSTDELTIRVNPEPVPHFWYWSADRAQDEAYHVKFQHLIEYSDSDGDDEFDENEQVSEGASFALSSGKWEFSGFTTESGDSIGSGETADTVKFSYTLVGPVRGKQQGQNGQQPDEPPGGPPEEPGQQPDEPTGQQDTLNASKITSDNLVIVLTCHTSAADGNKMKIDVYIENWNFASEDNRLALRTDFTTDNSSDITEENNNGYQIGEAFFAYEDSASADGQSVTVVANSAETEHAKGLKVWFNYPSFTETLDHDPTIGIGDLSSEIALIGETGTELLSNPSVGIYATFVVIVVVVVVIYIGKRK